MEHAPQPVDSRRRGSDPGAAEAGDGLRGSGHAAGAGLRRADGAGRLHPAAGGAGHAPGPDAADRRAAGAGSEPDPRQPRRGTGPGAQALSLLQRLATVGFGRKEEPQQAPAEPAPGGPAPADVPGSRRIRQAPGRPQGYRPAQGSSTRRARWLRRPAQRRKTISWRFRPSCAARRTDRATTVTTRYKCPQPAHGWGLCLLKI